MYGPESCGKTTLALHAVAEVQKAGGIATFIDVEHALDTDYAAALGVDMAELYIAQPQSGEQALEIMDTLVRSGSMDLIVLDSVAGEHDRLRTAVLRPPTDGSTPTLSLAPETSFTSRAVLQRWCRGRSWKGRWGTITWGCRRGSCRRRCAS